MTQVIDCRRISDEFLSWVQTERKRFSFLPTLATVLCRKTADPASIQYRDLMLKDAQRLGLGAKSLEVSNIEELHQTLTLANQDPLIHGIIVLYPLRLGPSDEDVMDLVSPYKDAEGLHSVNLGYLIKFKKFLGETHAVKCIVPATAKAVVKTLQHHPDIALEGSFVTIVNNSMRVGKPLGLMLENLGATVVKCYDRTRPQELQACVRQADILVTAVPDASFRIDSNWVKPGAVVLDISHQGNIDFKTLKNRARFLTTSDNRLGQVTRAMIFVNLIYCAHYKGAYYS